MPKMAIVSDIHANLPALEAVISKLEKENPDIWICLGDIVGYGPFPNECIEILRELNMYCVMGNHDAGVTGRISINHFREPNRSLIGKTKKLINQDQLEWLANLPMVIKNESQDWMAVHSSPESPENWVYLESAIKVRSILENLDVSFCFVGHTHRPGIVSNQLGVNDIIKGKKYMINPGSVGQSRDNDPRSSCGVLDTDELEYRNIRVSYNEELVLSKLQDLGYNEIESQRLMKYI